MADKQQSKPQTSAATQPTTPNRTGTWRFERPVFINRIAPCREACPVGEDIPAIMALNDVQDFEEAYRLILLENPFPGVCGQMCFHPCEKVCNRKHFDQAVSIRDLEYFASKTARESQLKIRKKHSAPAPKAAVLDGGPAALSCVYFLACLGYRVSLLEVNPEPEIYMLAGLESGLPPAHLKWEVGQILSLGIDLRLNVRLSPTVLQDLAAEFDALYISSTSRRSGFHLLKSAIDDVRAKRVILPTGAKRSRAVMLSKIRGTDTGVIYPEPSADADTADPGKKNFDPSKTIVRDIAAGKFAAMVTDISLQGAALDSIRKFAVGRLGALSMASYLQRDIADSIHHTHHIVRFSDLNTASFEKSNRIRPTLPGGLYSKRQAARSARRCFKCGTCTFCRKCYNYCPDLSIMMDAKRKYREIDYEHCKGCGICAAECPRAAIDWVKE